MKETQDAIRKHQETANWDYREEAKFWYTVAQEMDTRFFNGLVYPDGKKVPAPQIAFDDLRNKNTLACYDLFPDEYGIIGKITFNTAWYEKQEDRQVWTRGRYSQGETLCHEYLHLWQQIGRGKDPYKQSKHGRETHNKEFVQKAEELGIHPKPVTGVHTKIATVGSPIDILLTNMGIARPKGAEGKEDDKISWADWLIIMDGGEKPKGKSTLSKWSCGCQNVRVGTKDFDAQCLRCGSVFVRMDGQEHTVYRAK
jgi:hypothetical protein